MSFSAVTCLTYTGTTPLGGVVNIYSDVDSFTTPVQSEINLSSITGNECPYYIEVPDGTSQIRIMDIATGCYCDTPVQSNNLCVTCDLDFNSYSASTVGRIVAGNLTGTCESNITDYRIYWYETGDTTNPVYISGKGTEFTPYSFTHPLTGSSSIFAQAGTYFPVIDKIKLSGLTFSQTGGTGNIPAELECFDLTKVTVDAFTCSNGNTSDDSRYSHRVRFFSATPDSEPLPLESTFLFTGVTDYFVWKFCGFSVEDRLRLTYSGSAYSQEILLEDIIIGSNTPQNIFSYSSVPKSARTSNSSTFLKKVTCLTGLTRNPGDTLRLEVIPNQSFNETIWDFYFSCFNGPFEQETCQSGNTSSKIVLNSVNVSTGDCNTSNVTFTVSGCSRTADDFSQYIVNDSNGCGLGSSTLWCSTSAYGNVGPNFSFQLNRLVGNTFSTRSVGSVCAPSSTNTISFMKYVSGGTLGVIDMSFSDVSDFNAYYDSYLLLSTGSTAGSPSFGPWSGTPYDNTDPRYYRFYFLTIPKNIGSSVCGTDIFGSQSYYIHPSTQVITGTSGSNYTLRITMPTISKGITSTCGYESQLANYVSTVNDSALSTSNNFTGTTTSGSRYIFPFHANNILLSGITTTSGGTSFGIIHVPKYLNETIVYTGSTPTIVPSLTSTTFNFSLNDWTLQFSSLGNSYYSRFTYYYSVFATNPSDLRDFSIYTRTFSGVTSSPDILIYSYTGATSSYTYDSTYFII